MAIILRNYNIEIDPNIQDLSPQYLPNLCFAGNIYLLHNIIIIFY